MKKLPIIYLSLFLFISLSCSQNEIPARYRIDLSGTWQFALDTADEGIDQEWFLSELPDVIALPGTTDSNQKGFLNEDSSTMHLHRVYTYEGPAWYQKEVMIPETFREQHLELFFERTKSSTIWIDGKQMGSSQLLQSPQKFDVSDYLSPGNHTITLRIDNSLDLTPYGNVHIYTDETQTNWNGIIGEMYLEATTKTYISNLQVFPDIQRQKVDLVVEIDNPQKLEEINVELRVTKIFDGKTKELKPIKTNVAYQPQIELSYDLGEESSLLWDDYQQPLYELTVIISSDDMLDVKSVPFGMRAFKAEGTQFTINGRTVFLRGKHEAAVFPLTGHTPMDVESWKRVYRIAKTYGINHYRFHSYCPPEAAFTAADQEGIYLEAELPFWGGLESDTIAQMLRAEGYAMLKAYANHPSFVMFAHGNEIWSGHDRVEENILALKAFDDRVLYTMGCNNNIGFVAPRECSDFYVGARTPFAYDTTLTHTRLTHAFVDSKDGGLLNTLLPATNTSFDYAVSALDMPIISHEIGQYQIYPDYDEIDKYTGVLRARNLEIFRGRLEKAGLSDMDSAFQQASGTWSALCYKAEMEAALRTKGMAGFQLLDLQDFPGQGTALVGILDAFMDSKGVISPESWRQSCDDVVILLEFDDYCLTNNQRFEAQAVIANYSNKEIYGDLNWDIVDEKGLIIQQGFVPELQLSTGGLNRIGEIVTNLSSVAKAQKLTIHVSLSSTRYTNSYPIWVYPKTETITADHDVLISEHLNKREWDQIHAGANALWLVQPEDVPEGSPGGLFPPDFWNYGMFKGISEWAKKPVSPGTLGLLMDSEHPIFKDFPSDFHTNWQWFSIIKASHSLILDHTSTDYRPIVQVIDNLERNHKMGLIFEFKVGEGKLLVCMSPLNTIMDRPEARQLYRSMIDYISSEDFNPGYELSEEEFRVLF